VKTNLLDRTVYGGPFLDHMTAIADRIVKREMLSVLLSQDFSRRSLGIVARLQRCGAKRALPIVINGKQPACDRIAGFYVFAGSPLSGSGPRTVQRTRWRGDVRGALA